MNLCFSTANYAGRASGYTISPPNWPLVFKTTKDNWSIPEWKAMLDEIVKSGFKFIEVWEFHAPYDRITLDQVKQMRLAMDHSKLVAAGFWVYITGADKTPFLAEKRFQFAEALGASLLVGLCDNESMPVIHDLCARYNIKFALENHKEKDPQEILARIEPFADWFGAAPDTGWWAVENYDAVTAVEKLSEHILQVHLKDIKTFGEHETCTLGTGVVDIAKIVNTLKKNNYTGPISIEHEPHDYNPIPEINVSRQFVENLLK
jgi:sugar phosphate isomerase/epimerase